MPEAVALALWLVQHAAAFGLPDTAILSDMDGRGWLRPSGVAAEDWRKIGTVLEATAEGLSHAEDSPADRWVAAIGNALGLDPLAACILALALHYTLDQRIESLFDAMSQCRAAPGPGCSATPA